MSSIFAMTTSAKTPEPSKLDDRIDRIWLFFWGSLKTSYASAANFKFSSADLSPGFLSGWYCKAFFYMLFLISAASALLKCLIFRKIFFIFIFSVERMHRVIYA
jgi:hypothetical protein